MEGLSIRSTLNTNCCNEHHFSQLIFENPLEQFVIVNHLTQYLSSDDPETFKAFRQVCRLWREESQLKWNHLYGTLTISSEQTDNPTPKQDDHDNTRILQLDQFRQRYTNEKDILFKYPYKKYELRCWHLQTHHFSNAEHTDPTGPLEGPSWFWKNCALIIKQLTLHHCNSSGKLSPFSETILRALPNLTHLKVIGGSISPEGLSEINTRYYHQNDYFEHPNLKNVHIELSLPDQLFHELRCVFLKNAINLETLTIRRLIQNQSPEIYEISSFATRFMQQEKKLDNLDLIEYTSINPAKAPSYSSDLPIISMRMRHISGVVECFSVNLCQKRGRPILDLFLNPFCKPLERDMLPRLAHWRDVEELNIWGEISCSLRYLKDFKNLKVLRSSKGGWNGEEYRGRILRYLEGKIGRQVNIPNRWDLERFLEFWREQEEIEERKLTEKMFMEDGKEKLESRMLHKRMIVLGDEVLTEKLIREREEGVHRRMIEWERRRHLGLVRRIEKEKWGSGVEVLEVDWRVGGGEKGVMLWRGLKERMGELREMKVVLEGDEVLKEVGRLWGRKLERLELGHGTRGLTKEGVMSVVVEGMENLKEFRWRGCPCLKMEMGELGDWEEVGQKFREKLGEENLTMPGQREGGTLEGTCLEKEYEKALETGMIEENVLKVLLQM